MAHFGLHVEQLDPPNKPIYERAYKSSDVSSYISINEECQGPVIPFELTMMVPAAIHVAKLPGQTWGAGSGSGSGGLRVGAVLHVVEHEDLGFVFDHGEGLLNGLSGDVGL